MNLKFILWGTAAYTLVTFPIAILWHIHLFEEQYQGFNYIEGEPSFILGFITILIQGVVLSALYPRVRFTGHFIARGVKFSMVIGVFFWTSHVLAFVAKQNVNDPIAFMVMESFYLILQFGIYGVLVGMIYRKATLI